ncbi:diguanylate cyclase (GGDEF) domain-containing protein [Streptomyces sp. cf124]|uniref:SAV_2336 N-terminal domain-related protein n=1 Tax=Streptomyces sp. cf124 TaxID=1761903 RepID=UPI0008E43057|nr:SAV_2336 N-terminal domain-related protein [Streptomyces sp. cf124]SFO06655.1 diguanylate cyclase (GGDEF) domain-containing protein [Streptomyces sp. cf124]
MSSGAAAPAEPDELLVARLHSVLREAGAELSPRELSDVLWLALHTPPSRTAPTIQPDAVPPPLPAPALPPLPEHQERRSAESAPGGADRPVYTLAHGRDGAIPGAPIRIPAVRGLRHPLGIVRALRALKRRVPSAHRSELDENATAESIADSGVLDAVLRPSEDRWLHLVLAVDDGPSMRVWRDTVAELTDALTGSGIFRSVRVCPLDAPAPLTGDPTVVLAVTDAVADHWYTGAVHRRLAALARRAPTAVIHLFPTRLWSGTAVGAKPVLVRTTGPAPANGRLTVHAPWLPAALNPRPGLAVPVLELGEAGLRAWADLVASQGGVAALRVMDAVGSPGAESFDEGEAGGVAHSDAGEPTGVAHRIHAFRAGVSPHAYELAGHLASVDPLTLPVMRLVQTAALPESSPGCLAEVLLSGLMRVDDSLAGQDVFAFAPDVRAVLRTVINSGSAQRTVDAVSDYVAPRLGRTPDFPALIAERTGTLTLPAGGEPLAELAPVTEAGAVERVGVEPSPWGWGTHNLPVRRTTRWLPALEGPVREVVENLAHADDSPVLLCGPAGSDKTTVALEYAHRSLTDYALIWWVDARDGETLRTSLGRLVDAVAPTPGLSPERLVERASWWLDSRDDWLLVLDHVTDDHEVTEFVSQIRTSFGHVLITARRQVGTWATTTLDLTPGYQARNDAVTGLRHSGTLREQLSGLLCSDPQAESSPEHRHLRLPPEDPEAGCQGLAVLFCALDGMDSVITRFGAAVGDGIVTEVARRLIGGLRDDDTVARYGSDTFVILAAGLDRVEAQELVLRLRNDIIVPIRVEGQAIRVGAHFGIGWARCGMDADQVVTSARQHVDRSTALGLLRRLTDGLCELGSLDDATGRRLFAVVLGELLDQQIDLRGAQLREDVVALVRAALDVPDGEQALINTVLLFEGRSAADALEQQLALFEAPAAVTQSDGTRRGYGRPLPLSRLTEALSVMGCMEDAPGRVQFADLLGELLDRPIELRGLKLREDVVVLLRIAMTVPGWAQVLLDVVRILEGPSAAAELAWLDETSPPVPISAILSTATEAGARSLLRAAADDLSTDALREALSDELNMIRPPGGLPTEQLFTWALNFNAQPDGLPPAVLLMDCAAGLVRSPGHRSALFLWVDAWAQAAGLTEALERRRAAARRRK